MDRLASIVVHERGTPSEVSHRFADAINAGDVESALACWSPAGVLAAADEPQVRGHAALGQRFRELIAIGAQLEIAVSDEVCTEHGAMATTEMKMTIPTDGRAAVLEIAAVVLYVPGPGGLQILIDRLTRQKTT
jgi:ketosteroid isomerase-like protein